MANNSNKVVAGKPAVSGGVLVGPVGTTAPTNAGTALAVGFVALGYMGDNGLGETADRSVDKVKAWGTDVVKVLQTDFSTTFTFTMIESMNTAVLQAVYGASNVTTTAATTTTGTLNAVKVVNAQLPRQAWVFEIRDGNQKVRIYVPQGQITTTGDISYTDGEVIGHEVTVEAFYDSTLAANYVKYIDDSISSTGALL